MYIWENWRFIREWWFWTGLLNDARDTSLCYVICASIRCLGRHWYGQADADALPTWYFDNQSITANDIRLNIKLLDMMTLIRCSDVLLILDLIYWFS